MRSLLSSDYFPYGSQYYRAPSPRREDWDRDLGRMAELGFNTVKFWAQWRWNHPAEDQFYWDDLDELMDLSEKHGLRVMLNTILDVAPAWIYTKYPDASMLTLDGATVGPQTQPHRQIGGLGLSLLHSEAQEHCFRFIEECVKRYTNHPALEMWNVGSEPELTQSMAEMRRYADDASGMGKMIDYNPLAIRAFRQWLERKYGDIGALNEVWNRNYRSFDEAEVPRTRNTFNDLIDWRMFFVSALGEHVKRRFEVAAKIDEGRHPLLCHHVFIQGFPVTSTASDPWNVGQYGDLHGFTQMDDPMMSDILRSCARDKPVISAEMLMLMGYTLDLPQSIATRDVKRYVFTGVAANQKGFIFWQYRPETLGREAPTWGLTHLDGGSTPWLEAFAEVGKRLNEHKDLVMDAVPGEAKVALIYNPENQIFAWAASGNEKNATDSLLGAHGSLYRANYKVDFLHPWDFEKDGLLEQYRVIVAPFTYVISARIAERLKKWVADGGVLIAEPYFGGWDIEAGRHATTLPGYGMHEVFKVRQKNADPAPVSSHRVHVGPEDDVAELVADVAVPYVEMIVDVDLPGVEMGTVVRGGMVRETFFVEGAEVLASYDDGEPAITMARHGKGAAIAIGSYVSLLVQRAGARENEDLIAALVAHAAPDIVRPTTEGSRARVDVLGKGDERLIIVQHVEDEPTIAIVHLPEETELEATEIFSGEKVRFVSEEGGSRAALRLAAREVKVYRA
jgi:beta-galactosidase